MNPFVIDGGVAQEIAGNKKERRRIVQYKIFYCILQTTGQIIK